MSTREILTLQFGHYSNFIATHWWNVQELSFEYSPDSCTEINNDVLYREGQTRRGESTFTPRTLLVDLKGSLKALPEEGELYESPLKKSKSQKITDTPLETSDSSFERYKSYIEWDSNLIEVREETKAERHEYQQDLGETIGASGSSNNKYNFDSTVKVWSDFLYTRFHPRTVNVVKEYQHENDTVSFNVFPLGASLWKSEQFSEDFSDKIRNYVEECDSFQGFHMLTDATDAFSGLSVSCVEYIRDEYERKPVLAFPVLPSDYADYSNQSDEGQNASQIKDNFRVANLALCFERLAENSTLCVPLCVSKVGWRRPNQHRQFNHVNYNVALPYHTSAILASALDTFTLKYRLKQTNYSLTDLCADLTSHGRKMAAASLCLPFSINEGADLIDCLDNWEGPLSQSITPNCNIGTDRQMQIVTLRGIPEARLKRSLEHAGRQKAMPAYRCSTVNEMLSFYLSCVGFGTASNVTAITKQLNVGTPFPIILDSYVGLNGNIQATERSELMYPKTVPVLSGLHSGKEIGDMLESLHTEARRIKLPRLHQFRSAGLEGDDYAECLDSLFDLRECYEENYLI